MKPVNYTRAAMLVRDLRLAVADDGDGDLHQALETLESIIVERAEGASGLGPRIDLHLAKLIAESAT